MCEGKNLVAICSTGLTSTFLLKCWQYFKHKKTFVLLLLLFCLWIHHRADTVLSTVHKPSHLILMRASQSHDLCQVPDNSEKCGEPTQIMFNHLLEWK